MNFFELLANRSLSLAARGNFLSRNGTKLVNKIVKKLEKEIGHPDESYYERISLSDSLRSWLKDLYRFDAVEKDIRNIYYGSLRSSLFEFFLCYGDFLSRYEKSEDEQDEVNYILDILQ